MPINRIQGLRGLRGFGDLSEEERDAFIHNNVAKLGKYANNPMHYAIAAERIYNNQKFKDLLSTDKGFQQFVGTDNFDLLNDGTENSYNIRNQAFRDYTITKTFKNAFGGNDDFQSLVNGLDVDGMYDLLNNEEYLGSTLRRQKLSEGIKAANKVGKSFDAATSNPYVDALGAGFMQMGKTSAALTPYQQDAEYAKNDKEITEKLFAESQKRREDAVEVDTDQIYNAILQDDSNGTKSLAQTYKEFDKLATENSPHYATFKNSKWLKDYTDEDKLKDYAKFQAMASKYGQGVAMQYLDRNIQNRVAEAQDGSWTGNTLKGVLTTAWSDLGSNIALISNIGKSADEMAILNQGKDPNKPIYDKSGNIVDYGRNEDWLTNPAYWNNVYKYNTFSPTEIKAIEERGGISKDVNVKEYGYTPDFFSWDTVEEGFKQSGHILAGVAETGLTGGFGKAVGWTARGALKGIGLSAKAMQTAAKVGNITNDIFVTATTGLEGSQLEAMGTFDEQMQTAREKIQNQINKELYDYSQNIDYNSKEAKSAIDSYYKELKAKDKQRVLYGNREGVSSFPLSDETLREQAKQQYANTLLENKQKELQDLHKKDELEAARAAESAYGANFIMDYVKNIPLTVGIQKFKIAKGAMRGTFDNLIDKNIIADVTTGGVKRLVNKSGEIIRNASAKGLSKEIVKQLGGGFTDEYFDGINASFASGIGNNEFDNYIKKNYDPTAYNSATEGMLGNLLAGFSEGVSGLTDRQNLYEGFIGMVSPVATVMVNPNIVFNPKDTWKAVVGGVDANGKNISFAERLSTLLTNPILNSIAEAKEKDRKIDSTVEAINNVISANKDKLNDAAKIVSVLDNYDSPMSMKWLNNEDKDGVNNPLSFIDSKDDKLSNCFTLINTLNGLESVEGADKSQLYSDAIHTIQGLAEGTLSKEEMDNEVDKFLADPNNKSILDDGNGREIAAQKLQSNAKYFMNMKDKMSEIQETFAKSPNLRNVDPQVQTLLMYNLVASDDYKKRMETLEDELSLGKTDASSYYTPDLAVRYGTQKARENAVKAREREVASLQKQQDKISSEGKKIEENLKSLKDSLKYTSNGEKIAKIREDIKKQEDLLQSNRFQWNGLEEKKRLVNDEKSELEKLNSDGASDKVLTEGEILSLDARDRAEVLNPANRNNYSAEQLSVIDHTISNLLQNDPDAITKVRDAGILASRVNDLKTVYNRVLNNNALAATYLNSAEYVRNRAAMAESLQRGIDENYTKIEDAYINRENDPDKLRDTLLATNSKVVEAYMEDHPDQIAVVKPYHDILKFDEDASAIIMNSDSSNDAKIQQLTTIDAIQRQSNSVDEVKQKIESIIDSPDASDEDKANYNNLLSNLESIGYQRDATVIESREKRKEREAAARKQVEEEKARVEAEAQAAAEKAAEKKKAEAKLAEQNRAKDDIDGSKVEIAGEGENVDLGESAGETAETVAKETKPTISEEIIEKEYNGIGGKQKIQVEKTPISLNELNPGDQFIGYRDSLVTFLYKNKDTYGVIYDGSNIVISAKEGYNWEDWVKANPKVYRVSKQQKTSEEKVVDSEKSSTFAENNNESKGTNQMEATETKAEVAKDKYVIEKDGIVEGRSLTLEEQANEANTEGAKTEVSENNTDVAVANAQGENAIETNTTTLSGNAMSEYVIKPLVEDGILEHKKGDKEGDTMNKYFAWMDARGVKLQNIIDQELGEIIKRNPHAKVKFMCVKPEHNATNDIYMQSHLMLVLDYDSNINKGITSIHNDDNGGVIESEGKEYLIVGTVGYGNRNQQKLALYDMLWNPYKKVHDLKTKRMTFFNSHPSERFYVNPDLQTEIVPRSLIPGYIVKQGYQDDTPGVFRPISELLKPENGRNPLGFDMQSLAWGIQEASKFLTVKASSSDVMVPRNTAENLGTAFVLIPASNGKLVPSYLKVLKYQEMQEGALKNEVEELLNKVIAPNYTQRYEALIDLCKIFYFGNESENILLSPDKDIITLVTKEGVKTPFVLDSNFNRDAFKQAFEKLNPRVNITYSVLNSTEQLKKYDEAGALMTDAAMLTTAGSSYSIYGVDRDGKMIMPETITNEPSITSSSSTYKNDKHQIIYNRQYYHEDNGTYYLNGIPVSDASTIQQLEYNRRISANELVPVRTENEWKYFILSNGEHPEVVKVDKNSKEVKVLNEEKAKELIKEIEEEKSRKEREKNAEVALKANDSNTDIKEGAEDVDLGKEAEFVIDPETGEMMSSDILSQRTEQSEIAKQSETEPMRKEEAPNEWVSAGGEDANHRSVENLDSDEHKANTQTFGELLNNSDFGRMIQIMNVIKTKWSDAPSDINQLSKFLKEKNVDVDAIGTSEADIQAWIKTMEDCR